MSINRSKSEKTLVLFLIFTRRNRPKNTAGASYMENFQDIQAIVKVKKKHWYAYVYFKRFQYRDPRYMNIIILCIFKFNYLAYQLCIILKNKNGSLKAVSIYSSKTSSYRLRNKIGRLSMWTCTCASICN